MHRTIKFMHQTKGLFFFRWYKILPPKKLRVKFDPSKNNVYHYNAMHFSSKIIPSHKPLNLIDPPLSNHMRQYLFYAMVDYKNYNITLNMQDYKRKNNNTKKWENFNFSDAIILLTSSKPDSSGKK